MNYYNEFDHSSAEWLRALINQGLIPPGYVDERSIEIVTATDLLGYTQCHFFAGIGGWSLALRLAGWPDDRPVWTGSCPCQCFSTAGKGRGFADKRDLWSVFAELIRQCKPQYVFGEQVENAINHGWLDRVYTDMETENYAVGAVVLGAHSVGAPHQRQRLYWGAVSVAENTDGWRCGGRSNGNQAGSGREIQTQGLGDSCGVDDAESIGRGIFDAENVGKADGEIDAFADSGDCGCGVADRASERCGEARGVGNRSTKRASDDGADFRMADRDGSRLGGRNGSCECSDQLPAGTPSMASFYPWSDYRLVYCRDGKTRRIPAESLLFGVADGIPGGVDGGGVVGISEDGGFPLTTKKEGRAMLLKGYGNAIVPEVASEFIGAFMETQS